MTFIFEAFSTTGYDILNARKLQNFNSDINSIHFFVLGLS